MYPRSNHLAMMNYDTEPRDVITVTSYEHRGVSNIQEFEIFEGFTKHNNRIVRLCLKSKIMLGYDGNRVCCQYLHPWK